MINSPGELVMQKEKIYIETTLFNFYFDVEREQHIDTIKVFEDIVKGKYDAYTSVAVIKELEAAPFEKREKMMALFEQYKIKVLDLNPKIEKLADMYVAHGIIPLKYRTDGVHIAVAAVNDLDTIISMNFQHIIKRKTKIGVKKINSLNGYRAVEICTPMEVNENE